jgi:hypothetical protein
VIPVVFVLFSSLAIITSPPSGLQAFDTPNDEGHSITVKWDRCVDEEYLRCYEIYRSEVLDGDYVMVGSVLAGENTYRDGEVVDGVGYYYYVRAVGEDEFWESERIGPSVSKAQWFNMRRTNFLVMTIIFCALVLWYIRKARKGESLYVRKIPGLEAVDEAVGRSTEMGRPVLFVSGLSTLSEVATLAALSILGRVAKRTAQYEVPLLVPCTEPLVMTTAQEIVKQSYTEAGRPDLYRESDIFYLTYDQFGYAAGVDGIMLRDRPGAVFLQGYFYAEALILAETGHSIGAVQIAGTTSTTQLPFFVASCDYTLIGEEMFAASSYLSKEPLMLGTLKAEDVAKIIIVATFLVSALLGTLGFLLSKHFGFEDVAHLFESFVNLFGSG